MTQRTARIAIAGLTLAVLALALPAAASDARTDTRYLVSFRADADLRIDARSLARQHGAELVRDLPEIGVAVVRSGDPGFADRLARNAAVEAIVEDRWMKATPHYPGFVITPEKGSEPGVDRAPTASMGVTDPTTGSLYPLQWNLPLIGAEEAWAAGHLGDPRVRVAVLGTGIDYTHIELVDKVDLGLSRSFVPEDDIRVQNLFPGAHPIADLHFHSTLVAGLIGCNAVNVACIAPNVSLVGVKVQDFQENMRIGDLIAGIVYSANIGSDVIAMGLHTTLDGNDFGDRVRARLVRLAVFYARLRGAALFSESGVPGITLGIDADADGRDIITPAQTGAVCVGATGPQDQWSRVSNYGSTLLDISAPGGFLPFVGLPNFDTVILGPCSRFTQIPVLVPVCNQNSPSIYSTVGGAIGATAHAAGVAALVDSIDGGRFRGRTLERHLRRTSDDILEPGFDNFSGHGRINMLRAVTEHVAGP